MFNMVDWKYSSFHFLEGFFPEGFGLEAITKSQQQWRAQQLIMNSCRIHAEDENVEVE